LPELEPNSQGRGSLQNRVFRSRAWHNSYWFIALVAIAIGLLIVAASPVIDGLVNHVNRRVFASDWMAGILAASLSGAALVRIQMRRRELLARMQIIEDVNHHVRNALTTITLTTALRDDKELNALVKDASERVDWVLNHVLQDDPKAADFAHLPSKWQSGRQLDRRRQ
jgi:hypothetical protein